MPDKTLLPLTRKTFLTIARAAEGSLLFQHVYVLDQKDGQEWDVLDGGTLSCAFFVSCLLAMINLIDKPHTTVETTVNKMIDQGWASIETPKPGAVVCWPEYQGDAHIGIFLGEGQCISNAVKEKKPALHGLTLSDGREPNAFYWHKALDA